MQQLLISISLIEAFLYRDVGGKHNVREMAIYIIISNLFCIFLRQILYY